MEKPRPPSGLRENKSTFLPKRFFFSHTACSHLFSPSFYIFAYRLYANFRFLRTEITSAKQMKEGNATDIFDRGGRGGVFFVNDLGGVFFVNTLYTPDLGEQTFLKNVLPQQCGGHKMAFKCTGKKSRVIKQIFPREKRGIFSTRTFAQI